MSAAPEPKRQGFLTGVKWALDHGKALATAIGIVLTLGASIYANLKPEEDKKAETTYETLRMPVEEALNKSRANEEAITELKVRLDYYEKVLASLHSQSSEAKFEMPKFESKFLMDGDGIGDYKQQVMLPERPWEQMKK